MEQTETKMQTFLALLESQVGKGVYVWGGNGERLDTMTDPIGWIERHETSEASAKRAIALYELRRQNGASPIRAFDCSGLVYWALKSAGLLKSDLNSRGLYARCVPLAPGGEQPGDLVFHHDGTRIVHVGVCAGAEQIECIGRDKGVVKGKRRKGYWNRVGRFPYPDDKSCQKVVRIKGGSVRVRESDNIASKCIGIAHRDERYPLLGIAPSGWYRILYKGKACCITNLKRYTEVCDG